MVIFMVEPSQWVTLHINHILTIYLPYIYQPLLVFEPSPWLTPSIPDPSTRRTRDFGMEEFHGDHRPERLRGFSAAPEAASC